MFGGRENLGFKPVEYSTMCWKIITRLVCVYNRGIRKEEESLKLFGGGEFLGMEKVLLVELHSSSFHRKKKRGQGGQVLHSYWRRTVMSLDKSSTHMHMVPWCMCPVHFVFFSRWHLVFFGWLIFGCNVTKYMLL